MNRRRFFGTLFGLAIAPAVAVKVLSAPPTPKLVVHKPRSLGMTTLVGFKGNQYMDTGVVYAPYIPMVITSYPIESKVRKLKDNNWRIEIDPNVKHFW